MVPLLLLLAANSAAGLASSELFVAPGGSATAAGTQADPLGGIREARDAARKLAKPVTVRIAAGRYHAGSAAIAFDERDSGVAFVGPGTESTAGDKALSGEAVVHGGVRVPGRGVRRVPVARLGGRLCHPRGRERARQRLREGRGVRHGRCG